MKKHRQKDASISSIKKPREQEGGAEERKEKSGNDWPWKFVTHERQMPERPERSEDQTRNQRRVFFCNCGSANPRQPGSSPKPMNKKIKMNRSGSSRNLSAAGRTGRNPNTGSTIATAARQTTMGRPKMNA